MSDTTAAAATVPDSLAHNRFNINAAANGSGYSFAADTATTTDEDWGR
jgi:hypothetical protein